MNFEFKMYGKIIGFLLFFVLLVSSFFFLYLNLPGVPVEFNLENSFTKETSLQDYSFVPVFSENLRFNHNLISFSISSDCNDKRTEAMKDALEIFHEKMGVISFYEIASSDADIYIECSDEKVSLGESLFAAGEGGPSEIINTSFFRTIRKGKVLLYDDPRCDYPVVEIHELCHVFGFDHSKDKTNIMYNTSNCDQRISEDMVRTIQALYTIEPLPELVFSEVSATRKGKYLDFSVTVVNEGLIDADNISITVTSSGEEIKKVFLDEIEIGHGRTLKASNLVLPSRNSDEIELIIDKENKIEEFNKENNVAKMVIIDA
jgi:hypothetical protein